MLLLDEPLSALDAKVRANLREETRRLQLSLGITTVFVTRDQEEALSMADRAAVLTPGSRSRAPPRPSGTTARPPPSSPSSSAP